MMNEQMRYRLAAIIAEQMKDECNAIENYEKVLHELEEITPTYDLITSMIANIKEIISDEKNHLQKEYNILYKLDQIPTAED